MSPESDPKIAPDERAGDGDAKTKIQLASDASWKAQVQAEKEKLAHEATASAKNPVLPPASFLGLLNDFGVQAMFALGMVAPREGESSQPAPPMDLQSARYLIDTLTMLEEKTKSNLSPEESQYLAELLETLRMRFVEASRRKEKEESKIVTDETLIKKPGDLCT